MYENMKRTDPEHINNDDLQVESSIEVIQVKPCQVEASFWNTMTPNKLKSGIVFCFINFCTGAYYALPGPFLPQKGAEKGLTTTEIGIIFGSYQFAVIISTPIYGSLLTTIGAKFVYTSGVFICGSCSVLFGFLYLVPSGSGVFWLAVSIRIVEGLGVAAFVTASFAIIANTFPDKAAAMIGTLELFSGLGLMLAPPLGGVLYQLGGFGTPFWVVGCLTLISCIFTYFILPIQELKYGAGGGSMLRMWRLPMVAIVSGFVAAGAVSIGFLDVALALRLQEIYDFTPPIIGLMFLIGPGVYAFCAPSFGWIAGHLPAYSKEMLVAGFLLNAVGFTFLGPAPFLGIEMNPLWLCIVCLVCFGMGVSTMVMGFHFINQAAKANGFTESLETFALISGIFNTAFYIGAFLGPILGGSLVDIIGFEWAAFIIGSVSTFMCLILVMYTIASRCLKSRVRSPDTAYEHTPLLSDKHQQVKQRQESTC